MQQRPLRPARRRDLHGQVGEADFAEFLLKSIAYPIGNKEFGQFGALPRDRVGIGIVEASGIGLAARPPDLSALPLYP